MKFEKDWKRRLVQDNPVYAAMVENMDWNIGRIINKIKELGLEENTLIVFTSDNGGLSTAEGSPTTNGILKAGKGWMYEGGIRVPLIMYWKGKIATAVNEDLPVTTADIFSTLAKLVINNKHTISKEVDGIDIFSLMKNAAKSVNRTLYWHYPHYSNQGGKPSSAIREGRFKLIYNYEDASTELYDIVNDIQEKNNIAPQTPKIVKQLKVKLDKWLKQNKATYPVSNSNYVSTMQPE
jgi:arylsulfatase A-like enzyme